MNNWWWSHTIVNVLKLVELVRNVRKNSSLNVVFFRLISMRRFSLKFDQKSIRFEMFDRKNPVLTIELNYKRLTNSILNPLEKSNLLNVNDWDIDTVKTSMLNWTNRRRREEFLKTKETKNHVEKSKWKRSIEPRTAWKGQSPMSKGFVAFDDSERVEISSSSFDLSLVESFFVCFVRKKHFNRWDFSSAWTRVNSSCKIRSFSSFSCSFCWKFSIVWRKSLSVGKRFSIEIEFEKSFKSFWSFCCFSTKKQQIFLLKLIQIHSSTWFEV